MKTKSMRIMELEKRMDALEAKLDRVCGNVAALEMMHESEAPKPVDISQKFRLRNGLLSYKALRADHEEAEAVPSEE